jgi:hypothetical protein
MLHDHERTLGGQITDEAAELGQFALGQAAGGLVEQDQRRLGRQRAGQRDPLPHPVGQLTGPGLRHLGGADPIQGLHGQVPQLTLVPAGPRERQQRGPEPGRGAAGGADHDVLHRGQPAVQADSLQQGPGHAEAGQAMRPDVRPAAAEQHLAGVGPDEAAQHVQQRGLARSVRPDDAQHMPGRDGERDGVERGQPAETDRHVLHLKY